MAQLVLSTAAAAAAFVVSGGNPLAAQAAFALTSAAVGSYQTSRKKIDGPRLGDATVVTSSYGTPIPYVLGTARVAGQVWWASERRETASTSGGKGGGPEVTSYSYSQDVLFGLAANPCDAIGRIWLNGKLIWTNLDSADDESLANSSTTDLWQRITFYSGAADQLPDPTYEAAVGAGNAPAYRDRATVMIEGLQLGQSGQLGNFTFEVFSAATGGVDIYYRDISTFDATVTRLSGLGDLAELTIAKFGQSVPVGTASQTFAAAANTPSQFNGLTAFTAEAWVYRSSGGSADLIMSCEGTVLGLQQGWELTITSGKLLARVWRNNVILATPQHPTNNSFPSNQWVHCRLSVSAAGTFLDQDGVTVGSAANTTMPGDTSGEPLRMGGGGGFAAYVGFLDEVRVSKIRRTGAAPTERFTVDTDTVFLWRCDAVSLVNGVSLTLRSAVEALCERAGMPAGTYDASALTSITRPVRSMVLGQVGSTRAALEILASSYFFQAQLSDKLYFRPIATAPVLTIPWDDLAAGREEAATEPLPVTQASDLELPAQVVVKYRNTVADYQDGAESSDRLISGQVAQSVIEVPLGMTPSEAKAMADATGLDAVAALTTAALALPMTYARLEAGDVAQITQRDGSSLLVRLLQRSDDRGVLQFSARLHDASALISAGVTDGGYSPAGTVTKPAATLLLALDIPQLRDADDGPGWYAAVKPDGAVWPGGQVFGSNDNVEFDPLITITERGIFGTAGTALGAWSGGHVMDETSRLTVTMGAGELASVTRDALLADETVNAMLVGSEIVRFATATLSSSNPNVYVLSRFLRAQRGTDWATSSHVSNERAVLLQPRGMRRINTQQTDVGAQRWVKAVTSGATLGSVDSVAFTNTGESQKPLSPAGVAAVVTPTGNIEVSWSRRSRFSSVFLTPTGLPLGEATEAYQVDVVKLPAGTVLRTYSTAASVITYNTQQQQADGLVTGDDLRFDVYQISATVGRGRAGSVLTEANFVALPQIVEIELLGTFATGVPLSVRLVTSGGSLTASHTTVAGNTNLAGAATAFAAAIDALAGYTATSTGAVIRITGTPGLPFSAQPQQTFVDTIALARLQTARAAVPSNIDEVYELSWESATGYLASHGYQVRIQRLSDSTILADATIFGSQMLAINSPEETANTLAGLLSTQSAFQAAGLLATSPSAAPKLLRITIPAAQAGSYAIYRNSTNPGIVSYQASPFIEGALAGPALPQISRATIPTVAAGRTYTLSLNSTLVNATSGGADTATTIATSLASQIDALADYGATSAAAVVTITHASNNVPFSIGQSVISSAILIGNPVLIQPAS
jgi:hypothetical protein